MPVTKSSNKTNKTIAQPVHSNLLPKVVNDVGKIVANYLPAYAWFNSTNRISRSWYHYQQQNPSLKPSIQQIIESCKTEQDAIHILSDESIVAHLTTRQTLEMASLIPDMVNATDLIETMQNFKEGLFILKSKTPKAFLEYLKSDKRIFTYSNETVESLSVQVAEEIYISGKMWLFAFVCNDVLIRKSSLIASMMLATNGWIQDAKNDIHLYSIISAHKALACAFFNDPENRQHLRGSHLIALAKHSSTIASQLINSEDFHSENDRGTLIFLYNAHKSLKHEALKSRKIFCKFSLLCMATDKESVKIIYDRLVADNQLGDWTASDLVRLARYHEQLAKQVYEQHGSELNGEELLCLAQGNEQVGLEILSNADQLSLVQKVYQTNDVNFQGSEYSIGSLSYNVSKKLAELSPLEVVAALAGHQSEQAYELYIQAKKRSEFNNISVDALSQFIESCPKVRKDILSDTKLVRKLPTAILHEIFIEYSTLRQQIALPTSKRILVYKGLIKRPRIELTLKDMQFLLEHQRKLKLDKQIINKYQLHVDIFTKVQALAGKAKTKMKVEEETEELNRIRPK